MPIHEAEAVVVRHYAFADADRIVVLFTRESGLLRAVAKGVRRPKSRLGASLEPLNHLRISYYAREGAELSRLFRCETLHSYLGKRLSLDRICGFTYFAELILETSQENNANPLVFRLLLASLGAGERLGVGPALLRYFESWLLKLNGLLPNYDYCSACGKCVKQQGFYVLPEAGQTRCAACAQGRGNWISPEASAHLYRMMRTAPEPFALTPLSDSVSAELESLNHRLLEWTLEKRLKSYQIVRQVLAGY
jgi:DNA repair protein RecO (recombination protein O)